VAASLQLKGGNMELPIQARVPLRPVVADCGVTLAEAPAHPSHQAQKAQKAQPDGDGQLQLIIGSTPR
jgi:hypothetical protein